MTILLQILLFTLLGSAEARLLPRDGCQPPHCVKSGEYAIYNCGTATGGVKAMLDTLWGALLQATQDAESETMSPAYQTFLKDPESKAMVSNILAQSAAGAAVHPPNVLTNGAPVIYCLDRLSQLAGTGPTGPFDAFQTCEDSKSLSATQLTGTPFIGICPYFWTSGLGSIAAIPSPGKCLTVNKNNKFNNDRLGRAGPKMTQWAMFVLLEEIIHNYLWPYEAERGITEHLEVYDANDVLALSAQDAVVNAASYVLYVASK